jgi:hypothetical protein
VAERIAEPRQSQDATVTSQIVEAKELATPSAKSCKKPVAE